MGHSSNLIYNICLKCGRSKVPLQTTDLCSSKNQTVVYILSCTPWKNNLSREQGSDTELSFKIKKINQTESTKIQHCIAFYSADYQSVFENGTACLQDWNRFEHIWHYEHCVQDCKIWTVLGIVLLASQPYPPKDHHTFTYKRLHVAVPFAIFVS